MASGVPASVVFIRPRHRSPPDFFARARSERVGAYDDDRKGLLSAVISADIPRSGITNKDCITARGTDSQADSVKTRNSRDCTSTRFPTPVESEIRPPLKRDVALQPLAQDQPWWGACSKEAGEFRETISASVLRYRAAQLVVFASGRDVIAASKRFDHEWHLL